MKRFIDQILLQEQVKFHGTVEDLKTKLNNPKGRRFNLDWISSAEFKFLSKWSIGTIMVIGIPGVIDGIKGYGEIRENENGLIEISLTTKLRVEMYFITGIISFFIIVSLLIGKSIPLWVCWLLPIGLIWFWFIYRIQEVILFKKLKEHLSREIEPE